MAQTSPARAAASPFDAVLYVGFGGPNGLDEIRPFLANVLRGRPYYWIEEGEDTYADGERADHVAVHQGYVSVTPLQPDLTAFAALAIVEKLV